jgi:hypothetical protein
MLGSDHLFSITADCKVVSAKKVQATDGEGFNFVEDPDGPDLFLKDPTAFLGRSPRQMTGKHGPNSCSKRILKNISTDSICRQCK